MMINEPITLATDYMLTLASLIFGALLWRRGVRMWAIAFFFTAAGSFFGGTFHGFGGHAIWKATVYSIGLASLFLLLPFLRVVAIVIFAAYAMWMTVHDDFVWVIVDYGVTMLLLAIVVTVRWSPMSRFVLLSVVVSVIGAVVQQAPIPYHNDIYHVIQLAALFLLYRAGMLMTSETALPMTQPT